MATTGSNTLIPGGGTGGKGMGFTMNGGTDLELTSVTLRLNVLTGGNPDIYLMSNNASNNPDTILDTFNDPVFGAGIQNYVFTPLNPFTLQAATTYWIVFRNNLSTGSVTWFANTPGITPTGPDATHFGSRVSGSFPPTASSSVLNSYAVDATATAVPEPSTLVLVLLGIGATAVTSWCRRRP